MIEIMLGHQMTLKMLWWYSDLAMTTNDESSCLVDEATDSPKSFIF